MEYSQIEFVKKVYKISAYNVLQYAQILFSISIFKFLTLGVCLASKGTSFQLLQTSRTDCVLDQDNIIH